MGKVTNITVQEFLIKSFGSRRTNQRKWPKESKKPISHWNGFL